MKRLLINQVNSFCHVSCHYNALAELDALFASLQQRAFRGDL